MNTVLLWFKSLGNAGAVANAGVLLEQRRRDEWVVESLALRLERRQLPAAARRSGSAVAS
jgi:hypothetical protein